MNWDNVKLIFAVIVFATLFVGAGVRNDYRNVNSIEANAMGAISGLLDHEMVDKLLIQNQSDLINMPKVKVDLRALEIAIERIPFVKSAEVFLSISGELKVEFEERKPVARLVGAETGYVDASGFKMPLSEKFAVRLPLADTTNCIGGVAEIAVLADYVQQDSILNKIVTAYGCDDNGDLTFQTRVWNHKVIVGNIDNMPFKMNKFLAFYQRAKEKDMLSAYKSVNLTRGNQVVGEKI